MAKTTVPVVARRRSTWLQPGVERHRPQPDAQGGAGTGIGRVNAVQSHILPLPCGVVGTIEVLGIRAVGRHGVLPEEQSRSQPFEVDLRLEADLSAAATSDRLEDTVDYALVTEAVARIVELESFRLLERLADRIAAVCISLTAVTAVEVSVRKLRPPIPVHVGSVGVTIRRHSVKEHVPAVAAAAIMEPAASAP